MLLQQRAQDLGVDLRYETEVDSAEAYRSDYDVVVANDGLNSKARMLYQDTFEPKNRPEVVSICLARYPSNV